MAPGSAPACEWFHGCQGATVAIHVAVGTPVLAPTLVIGGLFMVAHVLALRRADRSGHGSHLR